MNASQDTKYGPTVVAETLRSLADQAGVCHAKIDSLEAGQEPNRGEILFEVGKLLDACENLRAAILSEDSAASWSSRSELSTLVSRLDEAAARKRVYLDLAEMLAAGTISHRRQRTRLERLALRDKAVAEMMETSLLSTPPELPGPPAASWMEWACSLDDDTNEIELQKLKTGFPRLDDFVRQLEIDWWHDGVGERTDRGSSVSAAAPASRNGLNGVDLTGNENINGLFEEPAEKPFQSALPVSASPVQSESPVVEEPVAVAALPAVAPAQDVQAEEQAAAVASEIRHGLSSDNQASDNQASNNQASEDQASEDQTEILPSTASSPFVEGELIELPSEALSPMKKGQLSFFPWDQIEQFTDRIESGKGDRKEARTIRALLAVSHWLEPRDQNPMTHAKAGIRALTGYPPTTEPAYVAPSDVMRRITENDDLPLLTGGADLLRWGLLQPSERNFQGVASVRRLTADHLKAWFSDLYRIALSDRQIDDISSLTSGIPYLVGELHKLIIPQPDDPPTWLGLARWIEIKARFEKLMPKFCRDLKKGESAVRLTDREISLLNMVVIVSNGSTTETIAANLSANWERQHHPEYRAFSSRDEASLAVLLELGLLPRRNVVGGLPSQALTPVQQDDAIRKIVELL